MEETNPIGTSQKLSERLRELSKEATAHGHLNTILTWAASTAEQFEITNEAYQNMTKDVRLTCERLSCGKVLANPPRDVPILTTREMVAVTFEGLTNRLDELEAIPRGGLFKRLGAAFRLVFRARF